MSSSESSRRFHFIREIASGGFGSVYLTKVIHADGFSRLFAVKLLHPRWSENEEIAARMRDEARLLGWLRHKNIVDVMDLTMIDGRCAVIMEYLDAVDLRVVIQHCAQKKTRVPLRSALEICAAVASALDAAYNRPPYAGEKPLHVIHRDIKPSNIMLDDSGIVKVLDFGVARAEFDERESKTQEVAFGSLEYMPPERLFFEPESPASDVYSLGATLYEILAQEKFGKAKLRQKEHGKYFEDRFDVLLDKYPLHQESEDLLHDLLMGMLAFDESNRPSASEAINKMRSFARRLPDHVLEEWAESVVPNLIQARNQTSESADNPGSLVGNVLTEDAKVLSQRSVWEENTGISTHANLRPLEDDLTGSLVDDARWHALKKATIKDMANRGELRKAAATYDDSFMDEPTILSKRPSLDLPNEKTVDPASPPPITATPTPPPHPPVAVVTKDIHPSVEPQRSHTSTRNTSLVKTITLMFIAGLGLGLIVLAGFVMVGIFMLYAMPTAPEKPTPLPPPAVTAPPPTTIEPPKGPHATFSSALKDTKKIVVRCTQGGGKGVSSARVEGEDLGRCSVTVLLNNGRHLRAKIPSTDASKYTCFANDERICTKVTPSTP